MYLLVVKVQQRNIQHPFYCVPEHPSYHGRYRWMQANYWDKTDNHGHENSTKTSVCRTETQNFLKATETDKSTNTLRNEGAVNKHARWSTVDVDLVRLSVLFKSET